MINLIGKDFEVLTDTLYLEVFLNAVKSIYNGSSVFVRINCGIDMNVAVCSSCVMSSCLSDVFHE